MSEIHLLLREIHQVGKQTRELLINPAQCPPLLKQHVSLAGISKATTGFRFVRRRPRMGQILVCFRGQGHVWLEGRWRKCESGMAYLTPPDVLHAYRAGKRWEVGWISYRVNSPLLSFAAPKLVETDPQPFEHILMGLHHEASTRREPLLLEYWSQLLRHHAERIVTPDHSSRLWRLWRTVQADLGTDWDLNQLARTAGLGPENLRRICLRENGHSPMQHLTHLRMSYAASLLATGRKINDVAQSVGYDNAFAFSTAFKRVMKASPSRFRK